MNFSGTYASPLGQITLASDGEVTVNGGNIILEAAGDGLKASPDDL